MLIVVVSILNFSIPCLDVSRTTQLDLEVAAGEAAGAQREIAALCCVQSSEASRRTNP